MIDEMYGRAVHAVDPPSVGMGLLEPHLILFFMTESVL